MLLESSMGLPGGGRPGGRASMLRFYYALRRTVKGALKQCVAGGARGLLVGGGADGDGFPAGGGGPGRGATDRLGQAAGGDGGVGGAVEGEDQGAGEGG